MDDGAVHEDPGLDPGGLLCDQIGTGGEAEGGDVRKGDVVGDAVVIPHPVPDHHGGVPGNDSDVEEVCSII